MSTVERRAVERGPVQRGPVQREPVQRESVNRRPGVFPNVSMSAIDFLLYGEMVTLRNLATDASPAPSLPE